MRHGRAVGIKFIIVGIVVLSIFGIFYNVSLAKLLTMSVTVTGVAYVIGDLFLLRRFGNVIASLSDFVLHFLTIWTLTGMLIGATTPITIASLAAAYLITATEPLFHAYMIERVFSDQEDHRVIIPQQQQFQTEFAEEQDPEVDKTKNVSENKQTDMNRHK